MSATTSVPSSPEHGSTRELANTIRAEALRMVHRAQGVAHRELHEHRRCSCCPLRTGDERLARQSR